MDVAQALQCRVKLVGIDAHLHARILQRAQHLRDAGVGLGAVVDVLTVAGLEVRQHGFTLRVAGARRHRTSDQLCHAVANEHAHILDGMLRIAVHLKRAVDGVGQILQGVEDGTVQVKYGELVFHFAFAPVSLRICGMPRVRFEQNIAEFRNLCNRGWLGLGYQYLQWESEAEILVKRVSIWYNDI